MNNIKEKKPGSVLGTISIIIAVFIGLGFVFIETIYSFTKNSDTIFLWAFPTLVTAPAGIIVGAIALFTSRAWVGLVLNILLLGLDFIVILLEVFKGASAFR